jgi:hypothetical protein
VSAYEWEKACTGSSTSMAHLGVKINELDLVKVPSASLQKNIIIIIDG